MPRPPFSTSKPNSTPKLNRRLAQAQSDALHLRDALYNLKIVRKSTKGEEDWPLFSDALAYAAMLTAILGRIEEANKLLREALALAIKKDMPEQITNAYRHQANVNEYASKYEAYRDSEPAALSIKRVVLKLASPAFRKRFRTRPIRGKPFRHPRSCRELAG
ncbi:hypothetical protein [Pelagicoccus sp. SDUM812002]|uniref:hypothetical protein n=1 Tax=Pelagicoccus sp. SDUM812002 TaxID=3041266 RepID=UPI00280F2F77|nr:hypothetical protein [Pelagicoccus sp. SDUM812002]MDQ8185400.1 hypothetical protein [Pelagicoccus sp. SDUM812002]